MELAHSVRFEFDLALPRPHAIAFVQDVERSLSRADFLEGLELEPAGPRTRVRAALPVNAALFGQQRLRFESLLEPTPRGARLEGLPLPEERPGWALVSGAAEVSPAPGGSRVSYRFDIAIHLALPEPEGWGGRALLRMIEYTAAQVLERISARFPEAVRSAAREVEAAYV